MNIERCQCRRNVGILLIVLTALACGDTAKPPRQLAGEIAVPQMAAAEWRLTPRFRIDADSADLTTIGPAAPNAQGGLALIQRGDGMIVLIGPDGRSVTKAGGVGDGPGEFRFLAEIGWRGDTLWATDVSHRRLSYFAVDGTLLGESRWGVADSTMPPDPNSLAGSGLAVPWGIRQGDTMVYYVADPRILEQHSPPHGLELMLARHSGAGAATIAALPPTDPRDVYHFEAKGGPPGFMPVPFRAEPVLAIDPLSERAAVIDSLMVAESGATSVRVTVIRTTGDTVYQTTVPFTAARIDVTARDSVEAALWAHPLLKRFAVDQERAVREILALMPSVYPPVVDQFIAIGGRVWLGMPAGPWGQRWLVLDADDGTPIAELLAPPAVTLVGAADGWAWGLAADDAGLQSPVRYTLTEVQP